MLEPTRVPWPPTYADQALRAGKITLDESRQMLRAYEQGLSGYTYLEREVDAKFHFAAGQLRLVPAADAKPKTGTSGT